MILSNKLTLCILSLFLLAFAAVPVMAHQMETNVDPHVNADPATAATPGTDHALVESIVLSSPYLTTASPIIATITFADGVAAIPDDPDTTTPPATLNEGRHAILAVPASDPTALEFEIGTRGTDGTYTYAAADGTNGPVLLGSIVKSRPEGEGDTGSGAVYTAYISFPSTATRNAIIDGHYRIGLINDSGLFSPDSARATFFMDTREPDVENVSVRPIGQNYANSDGEWSDPFEITFNLEDPLYESTPDDATTAVANSASGLDLSTIMFEVKNGNTVTTSELTFGTVQYTGSVYVVTATPQSSATADKPAVELDVTVKVSDMAGNEGSSTPATSVKLAARDRTGPGQGETTKPTLSPITVPDAPETDGTLVFTITFSEAIAVTGGNAFTKDDLEVSNATSYTLTSADNIVFKLTVMPTNEDFPVKVTIKANVMVQDANGNVSEKLTGDATYTPEGVLGVEIAEPTEPSLDGKLVFTFTFAEVPEALGDSNNPGAFTISDITTSNAEKLTAADLTQSLNDSKVFRLRVTPTDSTMPVIVQLNADSVRHQSEGADTADDATDDVFLVAGEIRATYTPPTPDTTAPVVSIMAPAVGSVNPLMFTIDFDEALSAALTVANLEITGAAATPAPALASVTTNLPTTVAQRYTLTVTGTQGTAVTVNLKMDAVMDAAGNKVMPLATAATFTIPMPGRDTTAPTLAIRHSPADRVAIPESGVVTFTFTFSEAPGSNDAAFTLADVTIENGSAADFRTVSALVYELDVTPAVATQPVKVTVDASDVSDTAGNNLAISVSETYIAYDNVAPTVRITAMPGTGDNADKVVYTFTFSEPLMASGDGQFTEADILRGTGVSLAGNPTKDATDDKVYTVLVIPAATGSTVLTLRTGSVQDMAGNALEGDQSHTYVAPVPPGPATITATDLGSTTAGATLTITFNKDPGTVMAGTVTLAGTGMTRMLTAAATAGSHSVALTWTGTDAGTSDNGSGTVTYTIPTPATSANPTAPANIMTVNIPANSFVVLVRSKSGNVAALNFPTVPPVGGTAVDVRMWAAMPDLHDLFRRSEQSPGGALVLRMSADDAAADRPAVGTVGISEIMSGRDLGKATSTDQAAGQWIELQNLNDKAVNVLIYAQKGSDGLISNGQLVNTAAGDNLLGNPGGMIVDAIQNIRNDGNQNAGGWNVKGKEGNSLTAQPFASMYRILPDKKTKYENADGSRFNNRKGTNAGHWVESGDVYLRGTTGATPPVLFDYRGTPGAVNNVPSVTLLTPAGRTGVSHAITINEVGNNSNNAYDWIELKGAAGTNLRNYMISIVTSNSSDVPLVQFPANDNAKIADSGVFLILASDPTNDSNHPIAPGRNVNRAEVDHERYHWNSPVRSLVTNFSLPNDGKFVLILRSPDNGEGQRSGADGGKGVAETGNNDLNRVVDVAGWDDDLAKSEYPNELSNTGVWPLHAFRDIKGFTHNSFAQNTVHQRNRVGNVKDGASGVGAQDNNNGKTAFGDRGWTSVGYRRNVVASNANGGTPGYPNGALHGAGATITDAVFISEIMYADAANGVLPQWIELRNASNSVAADLNNWRLTIVNHVDSEAHQDGLWTGKVEASILLRGLKIKPNGVVLITSRKGPRSDVQLADSEIFSLYPAHRNTFGMTNSTSDVINPFGFRITLHANGHEGDRNKWQSVDDVGNLATPNANDRRGNNERFDLPRWMWPDAINESGNRSSVARKKDKLHGLSDGQMESSWVLSSMDNRGFRIDNVYYGNDGDISTPGQTVGSPLPVNLSFFRPTLEDGKVVVRWTTESELDNAGFNIYRSESRNGEFTQVNEKLIQGKGTTAERSTYKWVDTSAKPGAIYYYQIEDVSFAGERTTLTTTKLKGLISAKNKLTTRWGELKGVQ